MLIASSLFGLTFVLTSTKRPHVSHRAPHLHCIESWPLSTLIEQTSKEAVERATIFTTHIVGLDKHGETFQTQIFPSQIDQLVDRFVDHRVAFTMQLPAPWQVFVSQNLPFVVLVGMVYLALQRSNVGEALSGRSKLASPDVAFERPNTTFVDVAGSSVLKRELSEIVEFLTERARFSRVGARTPRGVLMEGPPGTGKTLLARAIAGEANVPFYPTSGSDFVELYVGLGASRVRSLFSKARENAPSIVFIDEIDAVGKRRGGGAVASGGNDEREQTLNAILSEMDGFDADTGVVVLACTNRIDTLDPALTRPGRFDRSVTVGLPTRGVRREIAEVHTRALPLDASVSLDAFAARSTGMSGADIENVFNEAAIEAARENSTIITSTHVDDAFDRITLGVESSETPTDATRRLVAVHEAGHAIVAMSLRAYTDEVRKVTIRPRASGVGGYTLLVPEEDTGFWTRAYLEARLAVILGGRAAERVVFGDPNVTTGATSDWKGAIELANEMVDSYRFYDDIDDDTVEELLANAMTTATRAIETNRPTFDRLVGALQRSTTLDAIDLRVFDQNVTVA